MGAKAHQNLFLTTNKSIQIMKSTFKAAFLQNLVRKNKSSEGFTLIELLVVIIIVGVLSAIALPSFLNQVGKARGSEAKTTLGAINRAQQAYRLENGKFTGDITTLDAKITPKFFTYANASATDDAAIMKHVSTPATGTSDVKGYSSAVSQTTANVFSSIICESNAVSTGASTEPTSAAACATGYKEVK
jgi:type IV pilus assembly protein PilA